MNFTLKLPQNRINIKQVFIRLEILFWTSLIALMSESVLVQRIVRKAHSIRSNSDHFRFLLKAATLSGAGLLLGLALGFLSAQ